MAMEDPDPVTYDPARGMDRHFPRDVSDNPDVVVPQNELDRVPL